MKNYLNCLVLILVILNTDFSYGQFVHFSNLGFAPQQINPANIGENSGSFRTTAMYRNQFNNTGFSGYKTFELGIDLGFMKGFKKDDWVGMGISYNNDIGGSLKIADSYKRLGLSYHYSIKKNISSLALGIQLIDVNRTFNNFFNGITPEGIATGRDIELKEFLSIGSLNNGRRSLSSKEWNLGIVFSKNSDKHKFRFGLSSFSVLPGLGTLNMPYKILSYSSLTSKINETISLESMALFQLSEFGAQDVIFNSKFGYQPNSLKKNKYRAGLGFKTGPSTAIFLVGAEFKGFNFGLSYDLPFVGYNVAPGVQKGIEFCASFIGLFKKQDEENVSN